MQIKMIAKRNFIKTIAKSNISVKGFSAAGIHCGIKPDKKLDLALFYSQTPCTTAAFFTKNSLNGAHIKICKTNLRNSNHKTQAIVVNSGNANCANGKTGDKSAFLMTKFISEKLNLKNAAVLCASTGVIGHQLPIGLINKNTNNLISALSKKSTGWLSASNAILTTDKYPKIICVEIKNSENEKRKRKNEKRKSTVVSGQWIVDSYQLPNYQITKSPNYQSPSAFSNNHQPSTNETPIRILGIAKGAGMIAPNMATMLSFIFTDALISYKTLQNLSKKCVDKTFNAISVDNDTSPNDTLTVMANGVSGIMITPDNTETLRNFYIALEFVCKYLSMEILRDGEGATKIIDISIEKARTVADAQKISKSIGNSLLVKTAIYGSDPNWGRIISAAGASGVKFDINKVQLFLQGIPVFYNGNAIPKIPANIFKDNTINIKLALNSGKQSYNFFTCDLSENYIKINSEYTT